MISAAHSFFIDLAALTDKPFGSLEEAKSAANEQLEYFVDETLMPNGKRSASPLLFLSFAPMPVFGSHASHQWPR